MSCNVETITREFFEADMSCEKISMLKLSFYPCITAANLSNPIPVSIDGLVVHSSIHSQTVHFCINTRFQISIYLSPSLF